MRLRGWTCVVAAGATLGCGAPADKPSVVQWIDGTGSAAGDSISMCTERAREVTRQVAGREGTTAIERLDAASANAPTFRIAVRFRIPPEIAADPEQISEQRDEDVDALYRRAASVLDAAPRGGTEIVGALAASGRRLRDHHGPRYVYMCSDLLDRRLLALDRIDRAGLDRLLDEMSDRGEIPSLHGAKVVFDTTSAYALDDITLDQQAAIEAFYRALVERGGGKVVAYGAGVDLPLD